MLHFSFLACEQHFLSTSNAFWSGGVQRNERVKWFLTSCHGFEGRTQSQDSRWVKVKRWFIYKDDTRWNIYIYTVLGGKQRARGRQGKVQGRSKLLFTQPQQPTIQSWPSSLTVIHSGSTRKGNRQGSREFCTQGEKLMLERSTRKSLGKLGYTDGD